MDESKIATYRAQAETCWANAERTQDISTQRYWIQLAAAWTQMADNIAKPPTEKTGEPLN
jgi:hypothetical protein